MNHPSSKKIFTSTEGMTEECKEALRNLLVAIADTKLLLGYHYGEWTFGTPALEAAIACCSLGQAELGHVRLLHGILNTHFGDDPEQLMEARQPEEFACIAYLDNEIKDWAEFVAANYIVDLAVTILLHALKDSTFQPLHMSLEKMIQEEKYHIHHGQGWFRTIALKSDLTRKVMEKYARQALESVVVWFGPEDFRLDKVLVKDGIKTETNHDILSTLFREVGSLSQSLQLDIGLTQEKYGNWVFNRKISWDNWNPATRRLQPGGPDEEILFHLRGSKNRVFKLN